MKKELAKMEDYKDVNWSVDFEITVNGKMVNFWELSDNARDYILTCIENDYYSGTFED